MGLSVHQVILFVAKYPFVSANLNMPAPDNEKTHSSAPKPEGDPKSVFGIE